jgi:Skp family chaperone for outer membrane proteins
VHVTARSWCLVLALVALPLLALPSSVRAADLRVGYIDSGRIFRDYKDAQDAQQRFDREVQGWRDEASEKETSVKKLRDEVRDLSPILSSVKRHEREEEVQRAISEYERFVQDVWGPQGKAAKENERMTREVVGKIRSAVEKVAADRGMTLVLDAASGFIIYSDISLDLTTPVLQELAARAASTTTTTTPH